MLLNQRFYGFTVRPNQQARALYYQVSTMASTTDAGSSIPAPWHVNYPAPKKEAASVSREDVLRMLRDAGSGVSKDFVLVDLRRNDHEVYTWAWLLCLPLLLTTAGAVWLGVDGIS